MSGKGSEARLTHGGDPRFRELVRAMDREYGERFGGSGPEVPELPRPG